MRLKDTHNSIINKLNQWSESIKSTLVRYSNNFKRPTVKTKDMKRFAYVNFVGQVVAYSPITGSESPKTNLLLTDYTINNQPANLSSNKGNDYSIEKDYLLQCTLFDENAIGCPDLSFGDYVYITNAYCKLSKINALELSLNGNKKEHSSPRIHILNEDDKIVQGLKK